MGLKFIVNYHPLVVISLIHVIDGVIYSVDVQCNPFS